MWRLSQHLRAHLRAQLESSIGSQRKLGQVSSPAAFGANRTTRINARKSFRDPSTEGEAHGSLNCDDLSNQEMWAPALQVEMLLFAGYPFRFLSKEPKWKATNLWGLPPPPTHFSRSPASPGMSFVGSWNCMNKPGTSESLGADSQNCPGIQKPPGFGASSYGYECS